MRTFLRSFIVLVAALLVSMATTARAAGPNNSGGLGGGSGGAWRPASLTTAPSQSQMGRLTSPGTPVLPGGGKAGYYPPQSLVNQVGNTSVKGGVLGKTYTTTFSAANGSLTQAVKVNAFGRVRSVSETYVRNGSGSGSAKVTYSSTGAVRSQSVSITTEKGARVKTTSVRIPFSGTVTWWVGRSKQDKADGKPGEKRDPVRGWKWTSRAETRAELAKNGGPRGKGER